MKTILLTAAALIATPLMAQTTPATGTAPSTDQTTMPAPGQTTTAPPMTPPTDSTMATPPAQTTTPPADATTTPMAATMTPPAATDTTAAAAPTGKLPWCRAGQFTGCREKENAKGEGLRKN